MEIIVVGSTGFVGSNVAKALVKRDHNVTLLARSDKGFNIAAPPETNMILHDPSKPLNDLNIEADLIINCVGIIREFPRRNITFKKAHIDVVSNLLEFASKNDIKRFIQISALGVDKSVTSKYQKTKHKAEQLIINSGLNYTIFKPSIIYGPGDSFIPTFTNIFKKSSFMPVIGNGEYRLQPVHIDDLVNCITKSIDNESAQNRVFEIGGPEKLTFNQIIRIIGTQCGRPNPKLLHIPVIFAMMKAFVWDSFAWFPFTRDQIRMLLVDNITDDESCFKMFGIKPKRFADSIDDFLK